MAVYSRLDKPQLEPCSVFGFHTGALYCGRPWLWTLVRFWVLHLTELMWPWSYTSCMALGQHWLSPNFRASSFKPCLVWHRIGSPLAIPIKFLSPDPNFSWWVRPSEFILFCASYLASAVYGGQARFVSEFLANIEALPLFNRFT